MIPNKEEHFLIVDGKDTLNLIVRKVDTSCTLYSTLVCLIFKGFIVKTLAWANLYF